MQVIVPQAESSAGVLAQEPNPSHFLHVPQLVELETFVYELQSAELFTLQTPKLLQRFDVRSEYVLHVEFNPEHVIVPQLVSSEGRFEQLPELSQVLHNPQLFPVVILPHPDVSVSVLVANEQVPFTHE